MKIVGGIWQQIWSSGDSSEVVGHDVTAPGHPSRYGNSLLVRLLSRRSNWQLLASCASAALHGHFTLLCVWEWEYIVGLLLSIAAATQLLH